MSTDWAHDDDEGRIPRTRRRPFMPMRHVDERSAYLPSALALAICQRAHDVETADEVPVHVGGEGVLRKKKLALAAAAQRQR